MPRGGPLIADDFILPALNNGTYGDTLKWVDKNEGLFQLKLVHKNNSQWIEDYTKVFQDWDRMKGRTQTCYAGNGYLTDAKQRFKNAMRKCRSIEEANSQILTKFGLERRKQFLYFIYKKGTWVLRSRKEKDAARLQRVVSQIRELKDGKELNYTVPTLQLVKSTSVIKHTNNIGEGDSIYTVMDLSKPKDSEKQNFIRFNLPSNFDIDEQQANGFYIKVPSNALRLETLNLIKDQSQTQGAQNDKTNETLVNNNQRVIYNKESVIQRVDSQSVLTNKNSSSSHLNERKKSISQCITDDDSCSSDGENKLVVDFDERALNEKACENFSEDQSKESLKVTLNFSEHQSKEILKVALNFTDGIKIEPEN